jgi:hypothetical protein
VRSVVSRAQLYRERRGAGKHWSRHRTQTRVAEASYYKGARFRSTVRYRLVVFSSIGSSFAMSPCLHLMLVKCEENCDQRSLQADSAPIQRMYLAYGGACGGVGPCALLDFAHHFKLSDFNPDGLIACIYVLVTLTTCCSQNSRPPCIQQGQKSGCMRDSISGRQLTD